jgi:hypothetical protein
VGFKCKKCSRQQKSLGRLVSPQQKARICGNFVGNCDLGRWERHALVRSNKLSQRLKTPRKELKPYIGSTGGFRANWACPLCDYVINGTHSRPDKVRNAHLRSHGSEGIALLTQKQRMLDGGLAALNVARSKSLPARVLQRARQIEFWNATRPVFAHHLQSIGVTAGTIKHEHFGCEHCDVGKSGVGSKKTQRCSLFRSLCTSDDAKEFIKGKVPLMLKGQLSQHLLSIKKEMKEYTRAEYCDRQRAARGLRSQL